MEKWFDVQGSLPVMATMHEVWIATDVGGTFTDFIVYNESTGQVASFKISTTSTDQSQALEDGIKRLLNRPEMQEARMRLVVHGTTTATNAVLQRKGAKVALLTTEGFEDVIEIGRQNRPTLYELKVRRTSPLVPRELRKGVKERITVQGHVNVPLSTEELESIKEWLLSKKHEIDAVAISFLFSFFNSTHERLIKDYLTAKLSDQLNFIKHVSISSEIHPEFREYERTVATVLDAYVGPVINKYLSRIMQRLRSLSLDVPLRIMQSNGGVASVQTVIQRPVVTLLSGLAGGVLAGAYSARSLGKKEVITLDLGGTSTDVAVLHDYESVSSKEHQIGGFPLVIPCVDVETVGAGGGSIAWLFEEKILRVGPQSAEADPGPACYGKGGKDPTVTDADVVLGFLNPNNFAGGELKLKPELAKQVIQDLGENMGLNRVEAAQGVLMVFHQNIAHAINRVTLHRGYDPRRHSLVVFGGAGPTHGCFIAEQVGIREVIVPPTPGTWSAFGLITADFRHDKSVSIFKELNDENWDFILEIRQQLEEELSKILRDEGFVDENIELKCFLDCRYEGQSYELKMVHERTSNARKHVEAFHELHQQKYGFFLMHHPIVVVNVHVVAWGKTKTPKFPEIAKKHDQAVSPRFVREVWWSSMGKQVTPIYHREDLLAGMTMNGPLIIEQDDTTTVVPSGWELRVFGNGHLIITRKN